MSDQDYLLVYVTAKDESEATTIAEKLVTDRLVACANILPGMKSIYHWQGSICRDDECLLLLKTRKCLFAAVEKRIKELHSYTTPCIVSYKMKLGSAEYLRWIDEQTDEPVKR